MLTGRTVLRLEEGLVVIGIDDVELAFRRQDFVFLDVVGVGTTLSRVMTGTSLVPVTVSVNVAVDVLPSAIGNRCR